jgi:hypothetical protein
MIIANPIYDVVFKRLMENERVVKFFIGTLLDQTIESVEAQPQEFTYLDELAGIAVFRLDFMAVIQTAGGERKKVLIEIQKARNLIDLMRFRNYLAEQYKKENIVDNEKIVLPITTIYVLGFTLPEIETACVKVDRNYIDLINKTLITRKNYFIESLTHDCFIVQAGRITNRYQTRLDKLLSVFEQAHFTDDTRVVKQYAHEPDEEEVKLITDILHHSGTEPEERKLIEIEQEAWRSINAMFEDKEKKYLKEMGEKDKALEEKDKALDENYKAMEEKDKALEEKDREIEALKRQLRTNN